jgi:hypothetical protein
MKRLLSWTVACVDGLRRDVVSGHVQYLLSLDRTLKRRSGSDAGPAWAAGTAAAAVRDYFKIVVSKIQGARYAYVDSETNDSLVDRWLQASLCGKAATSGSTVAFGREN